MSQPWRQAYHSLLMEKHPTPNQQGVSQKIHQIQFQTSIQLNTGRTQIQDSPNTGLPSIQVETPVLIQITVLDTPIQFHISNTGFSIIQSCFLITQTPGWHFFTYTSPLSPTWGFFPKLIKILDLLFGIILFLIKKYYFINYQVTLCLPSPVQQSPGGHILY